MIHLDTELGQLKKAIIEMMDLVILQLEKSKEAYIGMDIELAEEIIHTEKRVNAMELSIDRICENILNLSSPVATDFRFVVSALKINSELERIADYAENIAKYNTKQQKPFNENQIEKVQLREMFDIAIRMMDDIQSAFETENTKLARKVYKKDKKLNKIYDNLPSIISEFVKEDPEFIHSSLYLFSTIKKLERVGDHIKNITEDIIYYVDAKVMKHKKKKMK
ncbi:MAG: phosphate signaling complex protein PhoU [Bacteroidota bacterium]